MKQLKKQWEDNRTEGLAVLMYQGLRGYNFEKTMKRYFL